MILQIIYVRKIRRGNKKWTIKRNWQHRVHKMKKNKTFLISRNYRSKQIRYVKFSTKILPDLVLPYIQGVNSP